MKTINENIIESCKLVQETSKVTFETWRAEVERLLGHSLDGNYWATGYSVEYANEMYSEAWTPEKAFEYFIRSKQRAERDAEQRCIMEAIMSRGRVYYRGYTIEPAEYGYEYYPTDEGRDDDADFDGESYRYCGNVKSASSVEAAKDEIDDLVGPTKHLVEINSQRTYEFNDLEESVKFAGLWGGDLYPNGQPLLNP